MPFNGFADNRPIGGPQPPLTYTVLPVSGSEIDISAYLGASLIITTEVMSRTGGNCCGGASTTVSGWNPKTNAWETLSACSVGGSTSDAYLTSQHRYATNNNIYTKLIAATAGWSNAATICFYSAIGGKI